MLSPSQPCKKLKSELGDSVFSTPQNGRARLTDVGFNRMITAAAFILVDPIWAASTNQSSISCEKFPIWGIRVCQLQLGTPWAPLWSQQHGASAGASAGAGALSWGAELGGGVPRQAA